MFGGVRYNPGDVLGASPFSASIAFRSFGLLPPRRVLPSGVVDTGLPRVNLSLTVVPVTGTLTSANDPRELLPGLGSD